MSLDLEVRIEHRVHHGLTLEIALRLGPERGVLFGPSGAGKTTILRLIAGLVRPDRGVVRLGDSVLSDSEAGIRRPLRERQIGLIFQDDLLFPHLDVAANVGFGLHRRPRAEADARVAEVASLCGIGHLLGRDPATLSGGERQRAGLARALAPRPRLLLCDEPFSALDLDARHALVDQLRRVQEAEAIPMLYVTHAVDEAVALGSRLFLLRDGRIAADGVPLDVLASASASVGPASWDAIRNVFAAVVERDDEGGTMVRIADGPEVVIPRLARPIGARVSLRVRADDIVLAVGPIGTLSARNAIAGTVERVVRHGSGAEVVVRTGGASWVVGVVPSAVEALGLIAGREVRMIVKARSCHVLSDDRP